MNKIITFKEAKQRQDDLLRKKLEESKYLSMVLTKEDINKIVEKSKFITPLCT